MLSIVVLVLGLVGLGLSVTVPLTMPNMLLMMVRVGASELSPWIVGLNVLAALLAIGVLLGMGASAGRLPLVALGCALVGGGIAAIPLAQLPGAISRAEAAMQAVLGKDYAAAIPPETASHMRLAPFSLADAIRGIDVGGARVTRDVPYRTVGGRTLLLDRYDPPGGGSGRGPHPGLLVVHGGSWRNGDKGEYSQASYYFAARGYVVYDIQYRLSGEARFPAQLEDVECALGYMRAHAAADGLDPERVAIFGRSARAQLALLAAYRAGRDTPPADCGRPANVKAAIAYYAPTDLRDDYINPAEPDVIGVRGLLSDFLGGDPDAVPDQYASATPQNWLDRPVPPTLLVQGDTDQIVLPRNAQKLTSAIQRTGGKAVTVALPWAGHGFDAIFRGPNSQVALYYWERFMGYALTRTED